MSTVGLDSILANQAATNTSSSTGTAKNTAGSLGVDDFFNLLVKQLEYQDPLNPVENTEFTAQLAQFSSLQALKDMKTSMDTLSMLQTSTNNLQALSLIGRSVVAQGNIVHYSGSSENLNFTLDDRARTVTVKIYDNSGSIVRTAEMKNASSGDAQFTWDGKDDEGNTVSQGKYYFTVGAEDYEGNSVNTTTYAKGEVTGVRYDDGTTYLTIGNKDVVLSDIQEIGK
jgi:flagellar basal-body rod modification protein FlgD